MHKLIRMIVWSTNDSEETIFAKAEDALEMIANENSNGYDYHVILGSKEDKWDMSGSSRWGNKPNPIKLESSIGKKIVDEGINYVREEAIKNLTALKELLKTHTPLEIYENMGYSKSKCSKCESGKSEYTEQCHWSGYMCGSLYLEENILRNMVFEYIEHEERVANIHNKHELDHLLDRHKSWYDKEENPFMGKVPYIVLADVHY